MKTLLLRIIAALVIMIAFTECKKDKKDVKKPVCRITSITTSGGVYNISYNSDGKISSISIGNQITNYTTSGNIVTGITTTSGAFSFKKIITLNSLGLATNVKLEHNASGTDWSNGFYEYSGTEVIRITTTTSTNPPITSTITWNNGNLTSINSGSIGQTLEYYTDKPAQTGDYFDLLQLINGFQVYKPKNALKSNSSGTTVDNFIYTFDGDGKITSLSISGTTNATYVYQYQCN
jgi:hypothetical protein